MINIHLTARNVADLHRQLRELLGDDPVPHVQVDVPVPGAEPPIPLAPDRSALLTGEWDAAEPEPPKEEEETTPESASAPEPEPDAPLPKMEDCRAALNALRAKHGPAAVRTILTNHGVNSFVDLDACEYDKVMREAENYGK